MMKHLKTFSDRLNEMYFGKGYESDIIAILKKAFPSIEIGQNNNHIEGRKDGVRLWTIELGPMPGYRYAKLSFYETNGEWSASMAPEKVEDAIEYIQSNS